MWNYRCSILAKYLPRISSYRKIPHLGYAQARLPENLPSVHHFTGEVVCGWEPRKGPSAILPKDSICTTTVVRSRIYVLNVRFPALGEFAFPKVCDESLQVASR